MMHTRTFSVLLIMTLLVFLPACQQTNSGGAVSENSPTRKAAEAFFDTYAQRRNWAKLLYFYREDMVFEDIALQIQIQGKENFKSFYNWEDPNFQKLSEDQAHLVLHDLIVQGNKAVARGYFNPFMWNGELQEWKWGSEFTIWLFFDDNQKIRKQIDFIEYPDAVLEDVIRSFRRQEGREM